MMALTNQCQKYTSSNGHGALSICARVFLFHYLTESLTYLHDVTPSLSDSELDSPNPEPGNPGSQVEPRLFNGAKSPKLCQ